MRLDEYLAELNKVIVLELDEERKLWQRFKNLRDLQARQRLIESYQPLVFKCAMPYRNFDNFMDLIQEGTVGLIEAAESFKFERGTAFSLYAVHRIKGRMIEYMRYEGRCPVASEEIDVETVDDSPNVSEVAESHDLIDKLRQALNRLPQNERAVLEGIYLDSEEARTVAQRLELSVGHIYRLQKQGIKRIRGMLSRFMQKF